MAKDITAVWELQNLEQKVNHHGYRVPPESGHAVCFLQHPIATGVPRNYANNEQYRTNVVKNFAKWNKISNNTNSGGTPYQQQSTYVVKNHHTLFLLCTTITANKITPIGLCISCPAGYRCGIGTDTIGTLDEPSRVPCGAGYTTGCMSLSPTLFNE